MSAQTTTDPDVEQFFAAQRRARVRSLKMAGVGLASLVLGVVAAALVASWDAQSKADRYERYKRGQIVVVRRGERVDDTTPSPFLPLVVGGSIFGLGFAFGAWKLTGDKTYLRGLQSMMRS